MFYIAFLFLFFVTMNPTIEFEQALAISVSGDYAESKAFAPHKATKGAFALYFDSQVFFPTVH